MQATSICHKIDPYLYEYSIVECAFPTFHVGMGSELSVFESLQGFEFVTFVFTTLSISRRGAETE